MVKDRNVERQPLSAERRFAVAVKATVPRGLVCFTVETFLFTSDVVEIKCFGRYASRSRSCVVLVQTFLVRSLQFFVVNGTVTVK